MHVISLYLVLYACVATFDVMCVKKTETTKRGLSSGRAYILKGPEDVYMHVAAFENDTNIWRLRNL
jgi:hypothetical protein